MSERKKTKRLVEKIFKDEKKRSLYTQQELIYMAKKVVLDDELHKQKKAQRKSKGFGTQSV
jgi:hypothetical protein